MNRQETAALIGKLASLYQNFRTTHEQLDTWHEYLEPLPPQVVGAAVDHLLRDGPAFAPGAPQIAAEARRLAEAANPDPAIPTPEAMWWKIVRMVREFPPSRDGEFLDQYPVAARAIAGIGGFPALRSAKSEDFHRNLQPRFMRLYADVRETHKRERVAAPIKEQLAPLTDIMRLEAPDGE